MKRIFHLLFLSIFLASCTNTVTVAPVITTTSAPTATLVLTDTPQPTPTETPQSTPTAEVVTEIPPTPTVIPDSLAEFDQMVASGEIPTYKTRAEVEAAKAKLLSEPLLPDIYKDSWPVEVFNVFDNNEKYVQINFVHRINFIERGWYINADGKEVMFAEVNTDKHRIVEMHIANLNTNDRELIYDRSYLDIRNSQVLILFLYTDLESSRFNDPGAQKLFDEIPEGIKTDLYDEKIIPTNIDQTVLVVRGAEALPPEAAPEIEALLGDN